MCIYLKVLGNSIKVLSANCQGLQNLQKRTDVINYLKEMKAHIICLQDTHWTKSDTSKVKEIWGNTCYVHGKRTNARGVAILLNNDFEYEVLETKLDSEGNYICLTLKISDWILNIMTIYAPNNDSPEFFTEVQKIIQENENENVQSDG